MRSAERTGDLTDALWVIPEYVSQSLDPFQFKHWLIYFAMDLDMNELVPLCPHSHFFRSLPSSSGRLLWRQGRRILPERRWKTKSKHTVVMLRICAWTVPYLSTVQRPVSTLPKGEKLVRWEDSGAPPHASVARCDNYRRHGADKCR